MAGAAFRTFHEKEIVCALWVGGSSQKKRLSLQNFGFVASTVTEFELERGVGNAIVSKAMFEGGENLFGMVVGVDDNMRGERVERGGERPDMEMVDGKNVRDVGHECLHTVEINALRDAIKGETQGIRKQSERGNKDDDRHDKRNDGVNKVEVGKIDDKSSDNNTNGDKRVRQHVEKGTSDVQIVFLPPHEKESREPIDEYADSGSDRDGSTIDGRGMGKVVDGLDDNGADSDKEDDGIEERNEYGAPSVAIGKVFGNSNGRQFDPRESEEEGKDIAEIMTRVGEQAEGVGIEANPRFKNNVERVEDNADDENRSDGLYVMVVVSHN